MSTESQRSICDWANTTFGPVTELQPCAERAAKEMREFQHVIDEGCNPRGLVAEGRDVVIALMRLFGHLGVDLGAEIDKKMALNRSRKWIPDGKGNGQHDRSSK